MFVYICKKYIHTHTQVHMRALCSFEFIYLPICSLFYVIQVRLHTLDLEVG